MNRNNMYDRFYDRALEDGFTNDEADKVAREQVEDWYWDRVDAGRQQAREGK